MSFKVRPPNVNLLRVRVVAEVDFMVYYNMRVCLLNMTLINMYTLIME